MIDAASALKQRLQTEMVSAMKAGEKERLGVIRLILAAIKQREIDERTVLNDAEIISVLNKMVKQGRESIAQYRAGGRDDLVRAENEELKIIQAYLPEALAEGEIEALIKKAITETGASSLKDMGKVMSVLRGAVQGRADMTDISSRVKKLLASSSTSNA